MHASELTSAKIHLISEYKTIRIQCYWNGYCTIVHFINNSVDIGRNLLLKL